MPPVQEVFSYPKVGVVMGAGAVTGESGSGDGESGDGDRERGEKKEPHKILIQGPPSGELLMLLKNKINEETE